MHNHEIADHFSLLSKLMDIHDENSFKAKSYSTTAYTIEKLPKQVTDMDDAELFGIRGIGDATGKKIRELLTTGRLSLLDDLISRTPPGILDILHIKGLGPKKIAVIWKELGIESIGELEYACNENRLVALKGFGTKTQDSILQSIAYLQQNKGFHLWAAVADTANDLVAKLRSTFADNLFSLTGDVRRQNEIVGAIDIVTDLDKQKIIQSFEVIPETTISEDSEHVVLVEMPNQPAIKFHITDTKAFYNTLFTTTGTNTFLEAFTAKHSIPEHAASEEAIFEANDLPYIVPALRETDTIIAKAIAGQLPNLIQTKDIKGIIHSHSTWSDGVHTLEQMATAARDQGFEYLVISDHSQIAFYANGLSPERVAAQHQEIDALNAKLAPFKIFKSIEADILGDGSLDYGDSVLSTFDLVIASVHSNLKMTEEKAMSRVLAAIRNPHTAILGHPTGRLLLSRPGYPLDHRAIIDACAEHNVVIEINAHPRRLDIDWRWIDYALERNVLLSIDPDAHSINGFHDVHYGVMAAQKGGLTAKRNLSSFSLTEFEAFLQRYKEKRKVLV